jgi:acetyl esterase/lipase
MTGSPEGSGAYGEGLVEMLQKTVMKTTYAEHPEVFVAASPTDRVNAEAPPFYVLQGRNDTLVPVGVARTFVERLRAVSHQPVAYCELPLTQHAFDVLASLRCQATTSGVADFLDGALAAHRRAAASPTSRSAVDSPHVGDTPFAGDSRGDTGVTHKRNLSDIESLPGI